MTLTYLQDREAALAKATTAEQIFSGYGLTVRPDAKEFLVGLLMVDRPTHWIPAG